MIKLLKRDKIAKDKIDKTMEVACMADFVCNNDIELIETFNQYLYCNPSDCEFEINFIPPDRSVPILSIKTESDYSKPVLVSIQPVMIDEKVPDYAKYLLKYSIIYEVKRVYINNSGNKNMIKARGNYFTEYIKDKLRNSDNIDEIMALNQLYSEVFIMEKGKDNPVAKGLFDKIIDTFKIYRETDFTKMNLKEVEALYEKLQFIVFDDKYEIVTE